jgi:arginyl-tRNA--protein-N-Asp/Glu arginylyltransferase
MKFFSSELAHNYGSYTFGYSNYCVAEKGDSLAEIYALGYLPYSGSPDAHNTLYMARSARVVLGGFELTSENRRIAKKLDGQFTRERIARAEFAVDETFISFCLDYFQSRHGDKAMPRERLEFILNSGFISHIIRYTQDGTPMGYVLVMTGGASEHYWFSFYDLSLARQSLGLWLMLDSVREAKNAGLAHYYLGTVYGQKALYKCNFEPLEWWDGSGWSSEVERLKERGRGDEGRIVALMDAWKENQKLF